MAKSAPILVVLGFDTDNKPHASRFAERDAPFVQRAAELMGFHVIRIPLENKELHALAGGLPLGKIFATGRASYRLSRAPHSTSSVRWLRVA